MIDSFEKQEQEEEREQNGEPKNRSKFKKMVGVAWKKGESARKLLISLSLQVDRSRTDQQITRHSEQRTTSKHNPLQQFRLIYLCDHDPDSRSTLFLNLYDTIIVSTRNC
jgi:hypothetical protein